MKEKVITDPTPEEEVFLNDTLERKPSFVKVRDKMWKCDWLFHGTERKLTSVLADESTDEDKVVCKCAALLRLNGLWKIKFFYPILWRYFYYIKQYREDELLPFITECKKKVIANEYLLSIMCLIGMRDTMMSKTRKEVTRLQAELLSEQLGLSQKSSQNS
jgi:hypothetical protein